MLDGYKAKYDFYATRGNYCFSSFEIVFLKLIHIMWCSFYMYVWWCHIKSLYDFLFCNINRACCTPRKVDADSHLISRLCWAAYMVVKTLYFDVKTIVFPRTKLTRESSMKKIVLMGPNQLSIQILWYLLDWFINTTLYSQ